MPPNRGSLGKMISKSALTLLLGFTVWPGVAAAPDFRLQKIANGVWAAIVNDEGLAGGNAGFVIGDDGVLVIDTFQDPRPARVLLGEIRKLTPLPIRFVVNTHYHLDHVNGNDVFAAAGATIVAHRNVRAWMRTENIKMLDPPVTPEKKARVQSLTLPTMVHDSHVELYLGSRRINVRYYAGHTGGDSVVWIPDAHVMFCGDMLWKQHVPNLIDASTKAWLESLDAMQKDYGTSTWVPGHGEIANGQDVGTFRKYLADLRAGVNREQAAGKSGDALVQALLPGLKASYGKWGFFNDYAALDIEQTAQELLGTKRLPPNSQP
jgi:glyoxylase-like metal-dependent hydrolase (beta-lactamase superfamily II)